MPSIWFRERLDTVRMFDTHVNLHAEAFSEDLDEVLARARTAGVTRFLAICDRYDNYDRVKSIANEHPDIWNTVGVHPHHAKDFTDLTSDFPPIHSRGGQAGCIDEVRARRQNGCSRKLNPLAEIRDVTTRL